MGGGSGAGAPCPGQGGERGDEGAASASSPPGLPLLRPAEGRWGGGGRASNLVGASGERLRPWRREAVAAPRRGAGHGAAEAVVGTVLPYGACR